MFLGRSELEYYNRFAHLFIWELAVFMTHIFLYWYFLTKSYFRKALCRIASPSKYYVFPTVIDFPLTYLHCSPTQSSDYWNVSPYIKDCQVCLSCIPGFKERSCILLRIHFGDIPTHYNVCFVFVIILSVENTHVLSYCWKPLYEGLLIVLPVCTVNLNNACCILPLSI